MGSILERVMRRLLVESSTPDTTGLAAVVVDEGGSKKTAVAYDVAAAEAVLSRAEPIRFRELKPAVVAMACVVRRADHGPLRGAWEVASVAGPGKLAYGLAYGMAGPVGIVPDRETVSPAARAAWGRVAASGGRKRAAVDDMDHPSGHPHHTEDPGDDGRAWGPRLGGDVLDWVYYPRGDEAATLDALARNHREVARRHPSPDLDAKLKTAGVSFFGDALPEDLGPYPGWLK